MLRSGFWVRLPGLLLALVLTVPGIVRPLQGYLLDGFLGNVNLIFHEAGHMLLLWAGEVPMLLGGSLAQLAVPLACAAQFWMQRQRYAAGLCGLWFAQSLAGVGAYIADAPTRQLDLITGDPDTHDWWQLFNIWDNMALARPLGNIAEALAVVACCFAVVLALWDDLMHLERYWGLRRR